MIYDLSSLDLPYGSTYINKKYMDNADFEPEVYTYC